MISFRRGIDIGGTFTDVIDINESTGEIQAAKIPTSSDYIRGTIGIMKDLGINSEHISTLIHGTTLATNALLERKGAKVGLIATKGFRDLVFIQRTNRKYHYDLEWNKPAPLVKRENCMEVSERVSYKGEIIEQFNEEEAKQAVLGLKRRNIESIAVVFLSSFVNPIHELKMKSILENLYPGVPISLSHEVFPRWREYERMSSTVADAFLKPIVHSAVNSFTKALEESNMGDLQDRFLMMKSNGGVMHYTASVKRPIDLTMSGPVGGVLSSVYFGNLIHRENMISMDMGGTSLDVSMINEGEVSQTTELEVEWGIPIKTSMVDVKTIGAGGGSIAWIDKGGLLRVGPQSAGANPGPACYKRGGNEPTVTDANLYLGRLNPHSFGGGQMILSVDASRVALGKIGSVLDADQSMTARMIIELVDSNMANALRIVSIDKGLDPREFTLVAFGGAGPLHASSLARIIGISEVVVPIYPGVFSAFGLTTADMKVDQSQTANMRSDRLDLKIANRTLENLKKKAVNEIESDGYSKSPSIKYEIEMRYLGQNYNIDVQIPMSKEGLLTEEDMDETYRRFHKLHDKLYGYSIEDEIIEFVNYKVRALGKIKEPTIAPLPVKETKPEPKEIRQVYFIERDGFVKTPIYERQDFGAKTQLIGPAVIEEGTSTTVLLPDQKLTVGKYGNMFMKNG